MTIAGIPLDFSLFAATLLCVALFHHRTLAVAVTVLDNIAAAMTGGTMAAVLHNKRVHIGFLAADSRPASSMPCSRS